MALGLGVIPAASLSLCGPGWDTPSPQESQRPHRMGIVRPMSQGAQSCEAGNGYKAPGTESRGGTLTDHLIQPLHFVSFKLFLIACDKSNSTDELMVKKIILASAGRLPACISIPRATCFNPFCF